MVASKEKGAKAPDTKPRWDAENRVVHASRLHALCSASGSERWLNCPGSVALSRTVPEQPPGPAALEGTRCHELAECILKHWEKNGRKIDEGFIAKKRLEYQDTRTEDSNWDMVDYAMTYVNSCIGTIEEEFDKGTPVAFRLEHRLTFNADMAMFGTADFFATGIRKGRPHGVICDLKYGKKRVKVENNSQLAFYAVALKKASKKGLETVMVRVVQPRINHWLSDVEYTAEELKEWNDRLTFGAEKALLQIGRPHHALELKSGGWCFWCPARDVCPAKANEGVDCFDEVIDETVFG